MTTISHNPSHPPEDHGHGPDHPKFLAHHFETPQQQFDSGKLGVWLFLTTEILLFSGLFCAYAVYRSNHPEIFRFAHQYLNKWYGALNTIVLIFSSFTMAWAVRASQTGERKLCMRLLVITIACGAVFMGVKGIEYHDKWSEALLPGEHFKPTLLPGEKEAPVETASTGSTRAATAPVDPAVAAVTATQPAIVTLNGHTVEQSTVPRAKLGPAGISAAWIQSDSMQRAGHQEHADESSGPEPMNTQIFFGIYFLMTGLHGIHVLAGMALIAWILWRTKRGDFSPEYFSPVDFVGLYWHIVDLIWIFLFPLLYLIGNN